MNIYEVLVILIFIMCAIIMISQYINSEVPRLCDVLQIMNIIPCYEIKATKDGKRLRTNELLQHINSPVKVHQIKDGILYIEIY